MGGALYKAIDFYQHSGMCAVTEKQRTECRKECATVSSHLKLCSVVLDCDLCLLDSNRLSCQGSLLRTDSGCLEGQDAQVCGYLVPHVHHHNVTRHKLTSRKV